MSTIFSKHFPLCFFNLKFPKHSSSNSSASPSTATTATFLFNHPPHDSTDDFFSSSSDSDYWDPPPPPDFASVFASQRFFFSSPGLSNSIIESPDTRRPSHSTTTTNTTNNNRNNNNDNETTSLKLVPKSGGIGVPKYSLNPYLDFRRSMQEMIESRELEDVREDWDYLHDLLLCYLALNPTHTHRYIVRAFTDLVVDLLSSTPPPPSSSSSSSVPEFSLCRKKHKTRRHKSFSGRLV